MAIYEFRCEHDGFFDVNMPIGTAPESITCSTCGGDSIRVISAPMIKSASRSAWTAAMDRSYKSRYEPEVVTSLPAIAAPRRTIPLTPKLQGLPRP